jgi:hypothetical protein
MDIIANDRAEFSAAGIDQLISHLAAVCLTVVT